MSIFPDSTQVSGQKEMSVVDLPDSKPLITGANPRGYKVSLPLIMY